jgi:hypothetical protein
MRTKQCSWQNECQVLIISLNVVVMRRNQPMKLFFFCCCVYYGLLLCLLYTQKSWHRSRDNWEIIISKINYKRNLYRALVRYNEVYYMVQFGEGGVSFFLISIVPMALAALYNNTFLHFSMLEFCQGCNFACKPTCPKLVKHYNHLWPCKTNLEFLSFIALGLICPCTPQKK